MIGYHGTDDSNFGVIYKNNFFESTGENHYLGEGVYFFIEGIQDSSPLKHAANWAIAHSYDKISDSHKYYKYIVFEADIIVDPEKIWDITVKEGLQAFNYFRQYIYERIDHNMQGKYLDEHIIAYALKELCFEAVIANFYIKFESERIYKINSRLPNTTIMVVRNPNTNIDKNSIKVVFRGNITPKKKERKNEFRRV